jgi:hypothetical protein
MCVITPTAYKQLNPQQNQLVSQLAQRQLMRPAPHQQLMQLASQQQLTHRDPATQQLQQFASRQFQQLDEQQLHGLATQPLQQLKQLINCFRYTAECLN